MLFWTNPRSSILQNSSCTATYLPSHKPPKSDEQDVLGTGQDVKTNLQVMFSDGLLHMDTPVLAGLQKRTFITSMRMSFRSIVKKDDL